jgi:hypothetical protein
MISKKLSPVSVAAPAGDKKSDLINNLIISISPIPFQVNSFIKVGLAGGVH